MFWGHEGKEHLGTEVTIVGGPGSQQTAPRDPGAARLRRGLFLWWNYLLSQHLLILLGLLRNLA